MRQKQMARLYWFVFALHLGVLWWFPFFPSQDGPTHVYNTAILRDLRSGGSDFGAFFDLKLFFTPNLGATVPLYFLSGVFRPTIAEKVFLTLFFGLLVGVMPQLLRLAGNPPFPASFLVFPLLYSRLTLTGFYGFMFGVPLWLWAMWLFWRMRRRPLLQRWLAFNACALFLFVIHLLPFACYVLACGCAALSSADRRKRWTLLRESLALSALPLILLGGYGWSLLMTAASTPGAANTSGPVGLLSGLDFQQNLSALLSLVTFEQVALTTNQFPGGLLLGALLVWLLFTPEARRSWKTESEQLPARRWLLLTALGLFITVLWIPDRIGELSLVKLRFGPLILLVLIPLLPGALLAWPPQRLLLHAALAVAVFNGVLVSRAAHQLETLVTALPETAVQGRFVAGYRGIPVRTPIDPLMHAVSYYCTLHRCVDVDNYQALSDQFFVRFKPNPTLAVIDPLEIEPTRIDWKLYPGVTYLLGWQFGPEEKSRLSSTFAVVAEKNEVSLWRRNIGE